MELDYDGIRIGLDYFYIKNLIVYNHLFFCFFFFQIDDIAMAGGRKKLRNLAPRNSYGSTFLGQQDPSASTSGTSSDFFDEINLNA